MKKYLASLVIALLLVVGVQVSHAQPAGSTDQVLREKVGASEKAPPGDDQVFESDFMWLSPASISGPANSFVTVTGKLGTARQVGGFGIGFLYDESKVQLSNIAMGPDIPAGWEIYTQWNVDGQAGCWIIGSGNDDDWIAGNDLRIATFEFSILQCGTGTALDLIGGACNWCHLALVPSLISVCSPEYGCAGGNSLCTLYLTDGFAGGTACQCPPCGCPPCDLDKPVDTWSTVKRLFL